MVKIISVQKGIKKIGNMNRPKIFISSTVYDLRDLRSALKFWLEEFGYQVQLSEFNDFEKNLDKNSYEACLQSIEKAQYFILFIGSRVGGYYDEKKSISITQQEYRRAYQVAEKNGLILIVFVRQELWDIKDDRRALHNLIADEYVQENKLKEDDLERISFHESKIISNAEFTFNFIDELRKTQQMKEAIKEGASFPKRNWVHKFSTFRDVIDVLKNELPLSKRLSSLSYLFNVKMEIANNLRNFFSKEKGKITFGIEWAKFAINEISGDISGSSNITKKYLRWLCLFEALFSRKGENLSTKFIDEALMSGEFLDYNSQIKAYEASDFHSALFKLRNEIDNLRKTSVSGELLKQMRDFFNKYHKHDGDAKIEVSNLELVTLSAIYNSQINILTLSRYVFAYINRHNCIKFSDLKLQPVTPFKDETKEEEDVSIGEILSFLERKL